MQIIKGIDHFVLVTQNLSECLRFYRDLLGLEVKEQKGTNSEGKSVARYALHLGAQKINIHQSFGEFSPSASASCVGALDFCLLAEGDIEQIKQNLQAKGVELLLGVVERTGAHSKLNSIYLKDPDGNLVEIAVEKS